MHVSKPLGIATYRWPTYGLQVCKNIAILTKCGGHCLSSKDFPCKRQMPLSGEFLVTEFNGTTATYALKNRDLDGWIEKNNKLKTIIKTRKYRKTNAWQDSCSAKYNADTIWYMKNRGIMVVLVCLEVTFLDILKASFIF